MFKVIKVALQASTRFLDLRSKFRVFAADETSAAKLSAIFQNL